jgi:DNA-binding LytR/AlgR family response regulator
LDDIVRRLPEGFVRCHKSYAANMRYIQRLEAGKILLDNGASVRVSRSLAADTKDTVFRYLSRQV